MPSTKINIDYFLDHYGQMSCVGSYEVVMEYKSKLEKAHKTNNVTTINIHTRRSTSILYTVSNISNLYDFLAVK